MREPVTASGMTPADFDKLEVKLPLRVYTARITYQGADRLDITRKTGKEGLIFAPSWALLGPMLQKRQAGGHTSADWEAYTQGYLAEMRTSYKAHPEAWKALLARPQVCLLCYCTDATQCHRSILAKQILIKLGASYFGERPQEKK